MKKIGRRSFLKGAVASVFTLGIVEGAKTRASATRIARTGSSKKGDMPRRELGTTGATVPILQLGTAQRMDPRYDKVMHLCFREGADAFDTALSYGWGSSQRAIANFIDQIGGERKKLWITSKSGSGSPGGLIKAIDKCLRQLRTDYLDLYLMHQVWDTYKLSKKFLRAGDKLRKSGKTRFFGFSCHGGNVVELMNRAAKTGGIDAILFSYSFREYGHRELNLAIDACKKAGIGLIAMKTNGAIPSDAEEVDKFRSDNFSVGQAKLKSVWADERIDSVASEMDSVRVARENIAAAKSSKPLSAGEIHQLNRLAARTAHLYCKGCAHLCEPAIAGKTGIADTLRFLMYHESYGKRTRARELYKALPPEARHFEREEMVKAAAVCPQGIDVAGRLTRAKKVLES